MATGQRSAKRAAGVALCMIGAATLPAAAWGYVGPGAGLSIVGSILAFVAAILLGVIGFIWYPVRRLLRSMRARRVAGQKRVPGQDADA